MPSLNQNNQTGKAYWRSLDELADTAEFRRFLDKEFADYKPEQVLGGPTRRSFVKLMAASMALGGASALSGCRRWPQREIAPYNERPEGRVPGEPVYYASAFDMGGVAKPLLVSTGDGRPRKVEGNADHPQSGGAADAWSQASVLTMYDPERSRHVLHQGERSSWNAFAEALQTWGLGGSNAGNAGNVAVLTEAGGSPAVAAMRERFQQAVPNGSWYEYEPINRDNDLTGAQIAFGSPRRTHLQLHNADVIAAFDSDFMGIHPNAVQHARQWAQRRNPDDGPLNRMWAADPALTVTSTNADRRLPTLAGNIGQLVQALAAELGLVNDAPQLNEKTAAWVKDLAEDLQAHEGSSVVTVGPRQPAAVHAAAHLINEALGNFGGTVVFTEEPAATDQLAGLRELTQKMANGDVQPLLILDANPVYDAPADLD
ncbi:MAG: TAT-variant-translocated molybdopterin oxidoreductase, partial [Phycisphaeraceae bacterium]